MVFFLKKLTISRELIITNCSLVLIYYKLWLNHRNETRIKPIPKGSRKPNCIYNKMEKK